MAATAVLHFLPGIGAPDSEENQYRLEKETDKTRRIRGQTKSINVIDILVDVTRENGDID